MKILPTGNRLLVKILTRDAYKSIVLPKTVTIQGSAAVGIVAITGPGYLSEKLTDDGKKIYDATEIKAGEKIILNMRAGLVLNKKYRLIREDEVIAKVNDLGFEIGDELFVDEG